MTDAGAPAPTFEAALAFAADLIRIPSLPGREEAVARRVAEEMEALGYDEVRLDPSGNVVGTVRGRGAAPPVMLSCHLDVVAEGDHDAWEHPPFSGEIADGHLHGRGAMDIKGPLALQTYAAAAMGGSTAGDLIVAHTVLEERGGLGMKTLLESGAVQPGAVIVGEATHGDVCVGHRGRGELEVVLEGVAGHASAPGRARNPVSLLPAVLGAVDGLAANQPEDPVLGAATLAVTGIDVVPESRNVIPDRITVVLDWRILPEQRHGDLVDRVRDAVARAVPSPAEGLGVTVRMATEKQTTWTGMVADRTLYTPGFLIDPDHDLVRAAARAVGRREGDGPARVRPWTFATDGGWCCGVHNIPTVGFAPGEERYAHTNRERLDVEEARWGYARYPDLVRALQDVLRGGR